MMRKLLMTTALCGLTLSVAFAQAPSPSPSSPPAKPPAAAPAPAGKAAPAPAGKNGARQDQAKPMDAVKDMSKPGATTADSGQPKFVASQGADKWVFSKFNGTDVIGMDNKKIGDVSDILFDKDHSILAYVVGVGGFLGIGEKSIAIEPSAFQLWRDPKDTSNNPGNVKLKISMTREQLDKAPAFEYYKPPASTAATPRPATTGMGGGPRQPADRR